MATQIPTVEQRVRGQAAFIASAAFTVLLPLVLVTLVVASAWTGWVNVMAMRTYLDSPEALPGVTWAVPVAVQTFIIAGEATMVLNSILCRRWIVISGAAAAVAGHGAETGAHVYYGAAPDTTVTMLVSAVACGGGWALVAALMHRGVEIANGEVVLAESARPDPGRSAPTEPDQPPSVEPGVGAGSAPTKAVPDDRSEGEAARPTDPGRAAGGGTRTRPRAGNADAQLRRHSHRRLLGQREIAPPGLRPAPIPHPGRARLAALPRVVHPTVFEVRGLHLRKAAIAHPRSFTDRGGR